VSYATVDTSASPILGIDTLSGREIAAVGSKAATLGALTGAGLPVPAGFVVDGSAYRSFVDETGIAAEIADRLAGIDLADRHVRMQAANDIRVLMMAAPLAPTVAEAVVAAYASLSGRGAAATVAVRSSAIYGDTASNLLSRCSDSFLCVRGRDALLKAVRRCWASANGEPSLRARHQLGLAHCELDVAVIVQDQISATRSGVMVTGSPGGGEPDRIVVEATYGLGQAPAAALVKPDRYLVDKVSLNILAREINRKAIVIDEAPPDGGVRERPVDADQAILPALLDRELRSLAGLGIAVEEHLRAPQVVEWSIDRHGRAWILQASPLGCLPARHEATPR
jgi:pyruvate,water dikinase